MEAGCWRGIVTAQQDITRYRDAAGTVKCSSRHPDNFMRLVPPFSHFRDKDRFCSLHEKVCSDSRSGAVFGTLGLSPGFATYVTWRKALNIFSSLFTYLYNKKNNAICAMKLEFRGNKWVYMQPLELGLCVIRTIYILVIVFCFQSSKIFEPSLT